MIIKIPFLFIPTTSLCSKFRMRFLKDFWEKLFNLSALPLMEVRG
ncbi:hypothetical protein TERMP_00052 [Thermococcus barophilus MP]|uniref:Uncharacterized protein n=1 Tax=Thermococcus barophilus (strain DSM 11836 / MP) TaxID=391623 RepID=F0LH68_THEBM|nr:hypothetical protein TERMP_00052 [Thermococcus barophilus MP]